MAGTSEGHPQGWVGLMRGVQAENTIFIVSELQIKIMQKRKPFKNRRWCCRVCLLPGAGKNWLLLLGYPVSGIKGRTIAYANTT